MERGLQTAQDRGWSWGGGGGAEDRMWLRGWERSQCGDWVGDGCHSQGPFLSAAAAAWASFASHAVEGSDHKQQEAHTDSHCHDGHSGLGGLGGHCRHTGGVQCAAGLGWSPRWAPCSAPWRHSPAPKWKTWRSRPCELEASQETPSRPRVLVTRRVSELLTQPCPLWARSAGCGDLG